jgi:hypothetical protein
MKRLRPTRKVRNKPLEIHRYAVDRATPKLSANSAMLKQVLITGLGSGFFSFWSLMRFIRLSYSAVIVSGLGRIQNLWDTFG